MLLSAWAVQCPLPVAWISLDEGDNDPARFLLVLAEGLEYCRVQVFEPSPDNQYLAYSVDTSGAQIFDLYIKDLASGVFGGRAGSEHSLFCRLGKRQPDIFFYNL